MKLMWLLCILLLCSGVQAEPSGSERPNIILIVSDDQGYPDLGCMNLKPIQTPHLDRLAAEGVRATHFYVTWPACTPSRGSLLTGRYPQRNGLSDMVRNDMVNYGHQYGPDEYAVSPEMTLGLDPKELTLGDLLGQSGYACGMVGKWDMGQAKRYLPLQRGFDFFYGHGNNGIDYYTHERYGIPSLFRGNERTEEDRGKYITEVFGREAIGFLREHLGKRPVFLYLAFNAPHSASSFGDVEKDKKPGVQAPEEAVEAYRGKVKDEKLLRYFAAVSCMDREIGKLMQVVKGAGEDQNTLVLFMSDNGGSGNGGNAPLKGAKSTLWEGGLRVPFIARWPGRVPAGEVTDAFLSSLEIVPTLLAASNSKVPEGLHLDGFNMLPVLANHQPSPRHELVWQRRSDKALRWENWKWIDAAKGSGLYDLSIDPSESKDLTQAKPDIAEMMRGRFNAWRREMDACEPRGPFRDY